MCAGGGSDPFTRLSRGSASWLKFGTAKYFGQENALARHPKGVGSSFVPPHPTGLY